jgi:NAD+ synthase
MVNTAERIGRWMRARVTAAHARGLVVGVSGGLDSAVVARLCQLAMPDRALGVLLPCHSNPDDERDARLVAAHFELPTIRVDLGPAVDPLQRTLTEAMAGLPPGMDAAPPSSDDTRVRMSLANLKPRLRMASLYFVANRLNYLVAGTGNRAELAIGYFTKHGDGGVDLMPLGRLLKSDVRALARQLGVPASIIEKPPTAGLWVGQTDEGEMGFSYPELEAYLRDGPEAVPPAVALRIERLIRATEHKRALPPMPDED